MGAFRSSSSRHRCSHPPGSSELFSPSLPRCFLSVLTHAASFKQYRSNIPGLAAAGYKVRASISIHRFSCICLSRSFAPSPSIDRYLFLVCLSVLSTLSRSGAEMWERGISLSLSLSLALPLSPTPSLPPTPSPCFPLAPSLPPFNPSPASRSLARWFARSAAEGLNVVRHART
jgi:hypothetical protein